IAEVDALFGRAPAYSRDQFVGIARLNADPPLLVVAGDTPWRNLRELVEEAMKRPGEITYASSGLYGASHVPMEMLFHAAGIRMRHLPTTGGGPAFPDVPTLKELGYDVEYYLWAGLFAP